MPQLDYRQLVRRVSERWGFARLTRNATEQIEIYAKTLSFFSTSQPCSIDFVQFVPMFRFDAAAIECDYPD